jgi:hypothetical protein
MGTKASVAIWLLLAVPPAALAADTGKSDARGDAGRTTGASTTAGSHVGESAGGPPSPAQRGVAEDLHDGQRHCEELTGKERAACDARAAATAQTPRGREGANPTGSSKPETRSGSSGR